LKLLRLVRSSPLRGNKLYQLLILNIVVCVCVIKPKATAVAAAAFRDIFYVYSISTLTPRSFLQSPFSLGFNVTPLLEKDRHDVVSYNAADTPGLCVMALVLQEGFAVSREMVIFGYCPGRSASAGEQFVSDAGDVVGRARLSNPSRHPGHPSHPSRASARRHRRPGGPRCTRCRSGGCRRMRSSRRGCPGWAVVRDCVSKHGHGTRLQCLVSRTLDTVLS
jgi:hypothetical protein